MSDEVTVDLERGDGEESPLLALWTKLARFPGVVLLWRARGGWWCCSPHVCSVRFGHSEKGPDTLKLSGAVSVGEEPVVADPHEAGG